uniref:SWIM-type domain-containing protein n=1 Tax=Quercus lobata TaxID=97700 RepID=A0A7N2M262_QUELO
MFVNLQVMEKDGKSNLEEVVSIDSEEDTTPKIGENADTKEDITPKIGMEFDSEDEAYLYYNIYAGYVGFSIRRDWLNRSKTDKTTIISRKYCCFKAGYKKEVAYDGKKSRMELRCGCEAQMVISRQKNGKYRITLFEAKHNHEVVTPRSKHKLPSQRKISAAQAAEAELANRSGIRQKLVFEFMSKQAGGRENLGFTLKDISNHLQSKRMREMKEGEAFTLIHYFEMRKSENASFFYEIQLDVDDQITNIFWADPKMVVDYDLFGDVVCFDTTYRTNKNRRPLAPIIGVNHHRQTVVFGAALLYDETAETFSWLFRTLLKVMCGKKPVTIFTDQDPAMAKAIAEVLPESHHRLCRWHIYQNALKKLNSYFQSSNSFAAEFKSCMCDHELLEDLRHNELDSNYDMSQRLPVLRVEVLLLKNSRDVYTPKIFNFFQEEYKKSLDMVVNTCYDISPLFEYKVCMYGCTREHKVIFNSTDQTVVCSCNKFEFAGFLCSHALKVLDIQNIKLLPSRYILKRWTKQARVGCVLDSYGCIVKEDPKLDITNRYKDLCRNAVNIASKAAETEEASVFLAKKMVELNLDVERILKKKTDLPSNEIGMDPSHNEHVDVASVISAYKATGIKKKIGTSRVKGRPKSFIEKGSRKRKHACGETPVTSSTVNIPASLSVNYTQVTQASSIASDYSARDGSAAAACSVWAAVLLNAIASISLIDAIAKLAYVSRGESVEKDGAVLLGWKNRNLISASAWQ